MIKKALKIKCPYCGSEANYIVDTGYNFILCDVDDHDGCDEYFAVDVQYKPVINTFELVQSNKDYLRERDNE